MRRALTRLFAAPAATALAALAALLIAGSPAAAQHAGYGYSYTAPPPPAPAYAPAQGFGRAGTYLYGYGGVGTAPVHVPVHGPVHGPVYGHDYRYDYSYRYDYGQAPGYSYGRPAPDCGGRYGYSPCERRYSPAYSHGHGYRPSHARGDYGRPARGYRDRDGYHDDRPPAYGRVEGGYVWIERGRRDTGYGCDCPRIPLYD